MSAWKAGQKIKLAEHRATKHYGVGGIGVVTAVKVTDPLNHRVTVLIRTPAAGFLHVPTEANSR
jgi:hypothetical protein